MNIRLLLQKARCRKLGFAFGLKSKETNTIINYALSKDRNPESAIEIMAKLKSGHWLYQGMRNLGISVNTPFLKELGLNAYGLPKGTGEEWFQGALSYMRYHNSIAV